MLCKRINHLGKAIAVAASMIFCTTTFAADQIKVGLSSHGLLFIPAFVADVMGYYEDEGLNAELLKLGGATKVYSALISGDVQFSISSSVSVLRGRAGGTDMQMIGGSMNQHASNIVASREWFEKSGLKPSSTYEERLSALKGLTISVASAAGGSAQLVRYLAGEAGQDPERDMTLAVLGVDDTTLAAFSRRRVDAITHSSPVAMRAIREHDGVMLFHMSGGQVPAYNGVLYLSYTVKESWAKEHPEKVVGFLRAMQRAHNAIFDPSLQSEVRAKVKAKYHDKIETDLFNASWDDYSKAFPASIEIDGDMVNRVNKLAAEVSNANPVTKQHVDASWTNSYAAKAVAELNVK